METDSIDGVLPTNRSTGTIGKGSGHRVRGQNRGRRSGRGQPRDSRACVTREGSSRGAVMATSPATQPSPGRSSSRTSPRIRRGCRCVGSRRGAGRRRRFGLRRCSHQHDARASGCRLCCRSRHCPLDHSLARRAGGLLRGSGRQRKQHRAEAEPVVAGQPREEFSRPAVRLHVEPDRAVARLPTQAAATVRIPARAISRLRRHPETHLSKCRIA